MDFELPPNRHIPVPVRKRGRPPKVTEPLTMSSREIATLTGKEHKNVLADVRSMLDALGLTSAEFSADVPDSYGRPQPMFNLPKDLTLTLVSGYDVQMRHRIVTRWLELEGGAKPRQGPRQGQGVIVSFRGPAGALDVSGLSDGAAVNLGVQLATLSQTGRLSATLSESASCAIPSPTFSPPSSS